MKVLICGEYGIFCRELIARLKKEKHDVFVITGSEKPRFPKPRDGVFQDYNFSFRSKSIRTVFKNIAPDALIILGACDAKFTWKDINQESVRYLTGMTNLLMGAKEVGISNVIYCSSMGIFEDHAKKGVQEKSYKEMRRNVFCQTMAQLDNICNEQNDDEEDFYVKKIHFPEVYGEYDVNPYSICNELMDELWNGDMVHISPEKEHRVVYVNDAVDSVMRVLFTEDKAVDYWVEGAVYAEKEIAKTIKTVIRGREVQFEEGVGKASKIPELSDALYTKVLFKEKYTLKDGLDELYKLIEKQKVYEAERDDREPVIRTKLIPVLENIGLFLVTFLLTTLLKDTWFGQNVNLYLFYVLIIGVVYGINHVLLATVLVFIAKTVQLLNLGGAFEYTPYVDVLQILIVGVITGYMRDKYKRKNSDLEDEKKYYQSELVDLTKIYDGNLYVKALYEKRLVNYENSMARIYEVVSKLDFWEPQKVIFQSVDVLKELMEMEDVAIYIAGNNTKYLRLAAATTELARSMGKSVCVDDDFFMNHELMEKGVYRNKNFGTLKPSYACGVFTQDNLTAIIMLWTNDLHKVNLYQANMLALLSRLIEASMERARLYWNTLTEQYIEGTHILQAEGIDKMIALCKQGQEEAKMSHVLLKVSNAFFASNKDMVMQKIGSLVRETDYVGLKEDGLYIILMNVNEEETAYVTNRFEKAAIPVEKIEEE